VLACRFGIALAALVNEALKILGMVAVLFHGIHNCTAGRDVCGADVAVRPAARKTTVTASDKFGSIIIRISN
jgi:hypothetical protein